MKLKEKSFGYSCISNSFYAILIWGTIAICGCGKGEVPNSNPEDIESAKFDAEKAENPNPMDTAIPPN